MKRIIKNFLKFIRNSVERTWHNSFSDKTENWISFSTRDHGSVYKQTPGQADIEKAEEIKKDLLNDIRLKAIKRR
jgi:hypothetical protein